MAATRDEAMRRGLRYGNESWDMGGWLGGGGSESEGGVETPRQK